MHKALALAALVALAAAIAWLGVRPGWTMPAGDFANYYTSARLVAQGEEISPAYSDFLWFQQRIDAAGFRDQLGGFIPHPPATALVMRPLVSLDPLAAKRAWTIANLLFAAACAWAIARLAGTDLLGGALALFATGLALANNLAFGQMYLLLLLSIAGGLLLVERKRELLGGLALGAMLPIKPFAAPLLVYFLVRREWRVVAGAVASAIAVGAAGVWLAGWEAHRVYVDSVLPALASGTLHDPFHPYWQSWHSLARRMFLYEPTLNSAPVADLPRLAAFVPAAAVVLGWGAVVAAIRAATRERLFHYAAILVATLALAPGNVTYRLVLLAVPFAILATRAERMRPFVVAIAAALALPLQVWLRPLDGGWTTPLAYPRLWLLVALLTVAVVALARRAERPLAIPAVAVVLVVAVVAGSATAIRTTPRVADGATPVAVTAPELTGPDRTVTARPQMRGGNLTFLAANPRTGRFERFTVEARLGPESIAEPMLAALSPDRRRLAFTAVRDGNEDIWVRDLATGRETRLTSHPGIDREPVWEDAKQVVFISDRGRGLADTALYRIAVPE